MEHGKLPLAHRDAGEDGVEEVQHAHQSHDKAQRPAQHEEHGPHALELRGVGGLALVVELGIHVLRVVLEEGLHTGICLVGGIKGVVHDAVRAGVLDEGLVVHDELVRAVVAVAQSPGHYHQCRHLILHVPVLHRPAHIVGPGRHVFQGTIDLAGVGVIVLKFLHIPQCDRVSQPGPVGVHLRVAVVVVAVHGGHIPPAGFAELAEIPVQHRQVVQGKLLHAIELRPVGQQTVLIAVFGSHHQVQRLRVVPAAPDRAVVVLGDKLLHSGGLAVDQTAAGDAALGVDVINDRLGNPHIRVKNFSAGLELAGVRHNEVAGGEVGDVLIHVKAPGNGRGDGQ